MKGGLARAWRGLAMLLLTLAGLVAIVGSSGGEDHALGCDASLQLDADVLRVDEGQAITLTLAARGALAAPEGWDLDWYVVTPDGRTRLLESTQSVFPDGLVPALPMDLASRRIEALVYGNDDGSRYYVEGGYYCPGRGSALGPNRVVRSNEVTLSVNPRAPAWISEPQSLRLSVGTAPEFSAQAWGDNDYQWERSNDGFATSQPIAGATALRWVGPPAEATDNGAQFRLRATGRRHGEVIVSRVATLTVDGLVPPPSFSALWEPTPPAVAAGSSSTGRLHVRQAHATDASLQLRLRDVAVGVSVSPAAISVASDFDGVFDIVFSADTTVAPGTYPAALDLLLGGAVAHSVGVAINVTRAATHVSLSLPAPTLLMVPGRAATVQVVATPVLGATDRLSLRATNPPVNLVVETAARFFTVDGSGTPVTVPFPLTFLFNALQPPGLYPLEFIANQGPSSGAATLQIDLRQLATSYVQIADIANHSYGGAPLTVGPGYSLGADVGRGELQLLALPTSGAARPALAVGIGDDAPLQLVNTGALTVELPAGALRLELEGRYTLPAGAGLDLTAELLLDYGPDPAFQPVGRVQHVINNNLLAPMASSGGGMQVQLASGDRSGLRATIASPAITLPPGRTLTVSARLALAQADAQARVDFSTVPQRLCLNLPAGVALEDNALRVRNWCR